MRNVRAGSIQEAVRAAIKNAGGLEAASEDLTLATSSLSRASSYEEDRPGGLGVNHLHRLGRITPAAAIPVARHFSELAGGVFQPLPKGGNSASSLAQVMKEFADVVDCHANAHSDDSTNPDDFTANEAQRQIREVDELVSAALSYKAVLLGKVGEGVA